MPQIKTIVEKNIPGSKLVRLFGKELSFVLPQDSIDLFPRLFLSVSSCVVDTTIKLHFTTAYVLQIENDISRNGDLGIASYGVSMTSLGNTHFTTKKKKKKKLN